MSLFDTLPTDVIEIIYQYDGRYKKEYDLLLKELLYRTPYWRIKFLDRKTENEGRFESKRKEIKYISDYWNNTYAGYYNEPLNQNVEEEYLTDNITNNYYLIFSDIKVLNMLLSPRYDNEPESTLTRDFSKLSKQPKISL